MRRFGYQSSQLELFADLKEIFGSFLRNLAHAGCETCCFDCVGSFALRLGRVKRKMYPVRDGGPMRPSADIPVCRDGCATVVVSSNLLLLVNRQYLPR